MAKDGSWGLCSAAQLFWEGWSSRWRRGRARRSDLRCPARCLRMTGRLRRASPKPMWKQPRACWPVKNARGSKALHIELIHAELRARRPGQDLFDRLTAGSGWGRQGERTPGGGVRPVSTEEPATPALRQLAREVLVGLHPSTMPAARKFFEPAQQDRALAVGRAGSAEAGGRNATEQAGAAAHSLLPLCR